MFAGATFLLSTAVQPQTRCVLQQLGAAVVCIDDDDELDVDTACSAVTHALVGDDEDDVCTAHWTRRCGDGRAATADSSSSVVVARRLRGLRVPVLREAWVHARVRAAQQERHAVVALHGTAAATHDDDDSAHVVYCPLPFAGVVFTTTQLPRHVKANVIASMLFCGARYEASLTTATTLVVYSPLLPLATSRSLTLSRPGGSCSSSSHAHTTHAAFDDDDDSDDDTDDAAAAMSRASMKLMVARARGVACVTVAWLQSCLACGKRLPYATDMSQQQQPQQQQRHRRPHDASRADMSVTHDGDDDKSSNDDDGSDSARHVRKRRAHETTATTTDDALRARIDAVLEQLTLP